MHKLLLNRAKLSFRILPTTPLLIKSGDKGAALLHPERPNAMFVRTNHASLGETVYIPGASLKGVVRSSAERILRSLNPAWSCDPMDQRTPCADKAKTEGDAKASSEERMPKVYEHLCKACRIFGSQAIGSRIFFADAYPPAELSPIANRTEARNGVSIDRKTGGPARGRLYDYEVVTAGAFDTEITLHNFELWQLSLLAIALSDISEGFVQLGSAKSRGLGQVQLEYKHLIIEQRALPKGGMAGIGVLRPDLVSTYRLEENITINNLPAPAPSALGHRFTWSDKDIEQAFALLMGAPWEQLIKRSSHGNRAKG